MANEMKKHENEYIHVPKDCLIWLLPLGMLVVAGILAVVYLLPLANNDITITIEQKYSWMVVGIILELIAMPIVLFVAWIRGRIRQAIDVLLGGLFFGLLVGLLFGLLGGLLGGLFFGLLVGLLFGLLGGLSSEKTDEEYYRKR